MNGQRIRTKITFKLWLLLLVVVVGCVFGIMWNEIRGGFFYFYSQRVVEWSSSFSFLLFVLGL